LRAGYSWRGGAKVPISDARPSSVRHGRDLANGLDRDLAPASCVEKKAVQSLVDDDANPLDLRLDLLLVSRDVVVADRERLIASPAGQLGGVGLILVGPPDRRLDGVNCRWERADQGSPPAGRLVRLGLSLA